MVLGYVHIGMTLGTGAHKDDGAFGLGRNPPPALHCRDSPPSSAILIMRSAEIFAPNSNEHQCTKAPNSHKCILLNLCIYTPSGYYLALLNISPF